ncbi:hypothetical protein CICLE_v10023075mg [Citrus x clementina]|uniref:Uncharacterized protein n=1 Tax=Citrus clementina TaxID=85681 RepID=V4U053_CITCL|nr:hypothetical protein CICLE_v10023075mg [Citrus x clementina]
MQGSRLLELWAMGHPTTYNFVQRASIFCATDKMAKKLRTKHNPHGPKREPSTMKIYASKHFIRHIKNLVWKCNGSYQNEVNKMTFKIIQE